MKFYARRFIFAVVVSPLVPWVFFQTSSVMDFATQANVVAKEAILNAGWIAALILGLAFVFIPKVSKPE